MLIHRTPSIVLLNRSCTTLYTTTNRLLTTANKYKKSNKIITNTNRTTVLSSYTLLSARCISTSRMSSADPPASSAPYTAYQSVVITLAGPDRVGIVSDLSACLHELQGNIEESRMTILGNDFAVILLTSVPQSHTTNDIQNKLKLVFPEFIISARSTQPPGNTYPSAPVRMLRLSLEGPDQPGVVRALTELLFKYGASIRDLDTDTSSAPFAGYRIFSMKAIVSIPTSTDVDAFHTATTDFENKYGFELDLSDANEHDMDDEYDNEENGDEDVAHNQTIDEPIRTATRTLSPTQQRIQQSQQQSNNNINRIADRLNSARDKRR